MVHYNEVDGVEMTPENKKKFSKKVEVTTKKEEKK